MLCPKCHSLMHAYERNGVVVDQCTECRGIFLDRGELEALVKAENAFYQSAPPPQPQTQPQTQPQQAPYPSQPQGGAWTQQPTYSQQAPYRAASKAPYRQQGYGRRKKSFLSELFD